MKKQIAGHRYDNKKEINVGITDEIGSKDCFYLEFKGKVKSTVIYIRPDEAMLLVKLLSELILKKVIGYEINMGRKTKKDY